MRVGTPYRRTVLDDFHSPTPFLCPVFRLFGIRSVRVLLFTLLRKIQVPGRKMSSSPNPVNGFSLFFLGVIRVGFIKIKIFQSFSFSQVLGQKHRRSCSKLKQKSNFNNTEYKIQITSKLTHEIHNDSISHRYSNTFTNFSVVSKTLC